MSKINKRVLIVEDKKTNLYVIESLKDKFDEVIQISDYMAPLDEVESVIETYGRLPQSIYSEKITPESDPKLVIKPINKKNYVKIQDLDLGEDTAYFVVGKLSWYYLRDFHSCHVGLRNTNLDWQIVHLKPYSLGSNKFVFCHTMTDEHYSEHMDYFFDDHVMTKTVEPLENKKVLKDANGIIKALRWATAQQKGTRFGLDYETNGLWRGDKYEDLKIIGFGIATKSVGFYLEMRFLSEEELKKVKSEYKKFLDTHEKDIWVFNVDYELMATRKFLGPWCIYEFKDADVWRIIYGDQIGYSKKVVENTRYGQMKYSVEKINRDQRWSLKYTAQKHLNVPSWDDKFEEVEGSFNKIFLGYAPKKVDDLMTNPLLSSEWSKLVLKTWGDAKKVLTIIKRSCKPNKGEKAIDLQERLGEILPFKTSTNSYENIEEFVEDKFTYKADASFSSVCAALDLEMETQKGKGYKKITSFLKKLTMKKNISSWENILAVIPEEYVDLLDLEKLKLGFLGCTTVEEVYMHPEWASLIESYPEQEKEFKDLINDPTLFGSPYAVQPADIVGKYCILDSYYTVMIAETLYEQDDFTPEHPDEAGAEWATTERLVNIFNANKTLGGLLNVYGLYKSNIKRDLYNSVQEKVRIYTNYIVAKGYYNMVLNNSDLQPYKDEKYLSPVFLSCLRYKVPIYIKGELDFTKVCKELFPKVYDPNEAFGWSDTKAEEVFGESLAETLKEILLEHKSNGFTASTCHNRATNLQKDCKSYIEEEWNSLFLSEDFDWNKCTEYYSKSDGLRESKRKLEVLESFNFKGMSLDEMLSNDVYEYEEGGSVISLGRLEMMDLLKKRYFDVATAKEVELGIMFEEWKDFRTLFTLYNPKEFKDEIDNAEIFELTDSVEDKVNKFSYYINNLINNYSQPKLNSWEEAKTYAVENEYTEWMDPSDEDMKDPLQCNAYIDHVISADLMSSFKLSKKLLDTYVWYMSIDEVDMKEDKENLLKYKGASPLAYRDWMLDKGLMCRTYDNLVEGDYKSETTENKIRVCDISMDIDYSYYPILATCFKLYRKYDKLGQYLNGQLVDSDHRLIEEDEDGIPKLSGMTKEEKHSNAAGDLVKMFPRYEIMQKSTKRNSSGIHKLCVA